MPLVTTLAIRGRDEGHDLEWREDGTANAILTPNGGRAGIGVGAVALSPQAGGKQTTIGYDPDSDTTPTLGVEQRHAIAFTSKDHGADAGEDIAPTLRAMGSAKNHPNGGGQVAIAIPINADALRGDGEAKTPSPDAEGCVRLRDPGLGVGAAGDPADTISAAGPGAVAFSITPSNSNKDYNAREADRSQAVGTAGNRPSARGGDVIAFDTQQITSVTNRTRAEPGLPASAMSTNSRLHVATTAVRRLTPTECERLQGFADGYTRIPIRHYKKRRVTLLRPEDRWEPDGEGGWWLMAADGQRYKALGNSMATPVMLWIGRRIAEVDAIP